MAKISFSQPEAWDQAYAAPAPWDISGPQPAMIELVENGQIRSPVLDIGCGTGEMALYLAENGCRVVAIDFSEVAIKRATEKLQGRDLPVKFLLLDALKIEQLEGPFATAVDCGLFHFFETPTRTKFLNSLSQILLPGGHFHALCFSTDEPGNHGPPRRSQEELELAFESSQWTSVSVTPARFKTLTGPDVPQFSPGGAKAWRVTARNLRPAGPRSSSEVEV